jgi:hypothetical protein
MSTPIMARPAPPSFVFAFIALLAAVSGAALAQPRDRDGAPGDGVSIPGHVLPALRNAQRVEAATARAIDASEEPLALTVVLRRSDPGGFEAYLRGVYDPRSPRYLRFVTAVELSDRFGPSREDYESVRDWFAAQGFAITSESANRMTLTVSSAREVTEAALSVRLDEYTLGERSFHAIDREPRLPRDIAARIQAVVGLNTSARPRPAGVAVPKALCTPVGVNAGYGDKVVVNDERDKTRYKNCKTEATKCMAHRWLSAADKSKAVEEICERFKPKDSALAPAATRPATRATPRGLPVPWKDADGSGQTVGITAFDTFLASDVADYLDLFGVRESVLDNLSQVHVNGGATLGPNQSEVLLDVDIILVTAPGAEVVVYDAPFTGAGSFQALFNRMIDDGVTIISNSWAYCEDQTTAADVQSIDAILATAAATGISVFNATGDTGSTCLDGSPNTVAVPAGSPNATAVGGTTLLTGPAATHDSESWWDGTSDVPPTGQGGFGLSDFFTRPSYQNGLHGSPMRSVPDVALNGDPAQGIVICQASRGGCPAPLFWGGTSAGAPSWAAATAVLNQALGQNLGNLNPTLYPLAASGVFHTPAELGSDFAHVGLGSPKLNKLLLAIQGATPGAVSPVESEVLIEQNEVPADGLSTATVVVFLRDAAGNTVRGKTVALAASPSGNAIITPASGVSNEANGAVIFEVKNATIEDVELTATDTTDGIELTQTVTIPFVAPAASSGGIAAMPTSVAADGASTTTITVMLLDENGMGAVDKVVTLDQGPGRSVVSSPTPATTNASGQVTFTATNRFAETINYTAVDVTDGNLPIPGQAAVSFTNASPQPCPLAQPMAAAGYAVSSFATSFPFGFFGGCAGAAGMAFDPIGNLFVVDEADGHLYKFGPAGGIANATTRITTTPYVIGTCVQGLAFSKDGEHLYMARQGCGTGGDVVEISAVDGHIIRTVAPSILCATGIATDPLSGDLFVSSPCPPSTPGHGGNNQIHRIVNPTSPTPTVVPYSTPGHAQGLVFTPDGTLWATALRYDLNPDRRDIVKIAGTASASPGQVTVLHSQIAAEPLFVATNVVPELDSDDPGNPQAVYAINGNGGLYRLDLTQSPPAPTPMATGGDVIIFMIGGPDGCLYFDDRDRVVRVTAADGSCHGTPSTAAPTMSLTPRSAVPNPAQGTEYTLTAQLVNLEVPENTPVFFMIDGANQQRGIGRTDPDGRATFTYAGLTPGRDTVLADATVGGTLVTSNRVSVDWDAGPHTSFLSLDRGPGGARAGVPVTLVATLTDVAGDPAVAIAGATVELSVGGQSCNDATNAGGIASCAVTLNTPGVFTLTAEFDGTPGHLPDSDSIQFVVSSEPPPCAPDCFDVDLNGQLQPLTDGLLILRYLFGFTGPTLVAGALGSGATRTDPAAIVAYLDSIRVTVLDLDLDGLAQPLTDGLLLLRYLFGFRGAVLIANAVDADCTRCDAAAIEGFIQSVLGGA